MGGIFFKEQVERLAELHPEHHFYVLYFGNSELELKPQAISQTIRNWKEFELIPQLPKSLPNLTFISSPILTVPRKVGGWAMLPKQIARTLRKKMPEVRFDLIHALVGYPAGVIAESLSKKWSIPYLITEVMGPFPFPHLRTSNGKIWGPLLSAYMNAGANIGDGLVKADTMRKEGIPRVEYIPNFINEDRFKVVPRAKREKFHFFTLAGFNQGKGLDVLLRAIAALPRRQDFHFVVAGGGPLEGDLKAQAKRLGIEDCVEWRGPLDREQALQAFQDCDAFVLPSRHESFGIVYVEAMFCGRAVVATRCGGPQEYVNEQTGILCDVDDVSQLAQAMVQMRDATDKYPAQQVHDWAFSQYGSKRVCDQIVGCYQRVIDQY